MDTMDSIVALIQKNLLDIVTILWILWFSGVALGIVISTVSNCLRRRTLARLSQGQEHARMEQDQVPVQIYLDPEQVKNALIRREAELRQDAERMGLDFAIQGVLENFRSRIQQKQEDLPATYKELEDRLQNIYRALYNFRNSCGPDQVALARMALKRGAPGKALTLLKRALSLSNQQAAEAPGSRLAGAWNKRLAASAAYLIGQLAETDFDYFTATQYYQLAADLHPYNLMYLKTAAEVSYAFGEFNETGQLLEKVLNIQEKLLGPEHLDLAQTLNNLGVLRHTEGRFAEAEAYYLWALEICQAHKQPLDQDAVNLTQNYAAFLKEIGRHREAVAIKARVAPA